MKHPTMMLAGYNMVSNDTFFDKGTNMFLISGPNMGGKSTLLR